MARFLFFFLSAAALLFLTFPTQTSSVEFEVINKVPQSPGGLRFTNNIGLKYSQQLITNATDFIWKLFEENSEADRKNITRVSLFVDNVMGIAVTINNEIHISSLYIESYKGNVKSEISGVIYHEMTHVWQWFGNGSTPGGLLEGVADYVRLKSGYAPKEWEGSGIGNRWDEGFDVTARFLDYCDGLRNGFVAELNKKMRNGYDDNYFVDLLGKTPDQLWTEYKNNHWR